MVGLKFTYTKAYWDETRTKAIFEFTTTTNEQEFNLKETIAFPAAIPETHESEALIRALHIAVGISYYKTFIPPVIEHPYKMSVSEASFWNTVFKNGLGEFLFTNKIPVSRLATFSKQDGLEVLSTTKTSFHKQAMLGIGGGKDSIVAGELLNKIGIVVKGFVLATREIVGQTQAVAEVMDIPLHTVKRSIDRSIIEMNNLDGAHNGHIPISVIFALIGSMVAVAEKSTYVVVANESSASLPQAIHDGNSVNHQWSKSIEFERLFQDFIHATVSSDIHYFSAIRPLTSVAIAQHFVNYPDYFEVFTSDNSLFKIDQTERTHPRWSRNSSKSLSSYILFAPYLEKSDLDKIFGHDFLDDPELIPLFSALLGQNGASVLDCVGTPDELRSSLAETVKQQKFKDSSLIAYAQENNLLQGCRPLQDFTTLHEDAFPIQLREKLLKELS